MTTVSQPDVTVNVLAAQQTLSTAPTRVLAIGQMVATGTATAAALTTEIANGGAEDTLFGQNSMLAGMVRAYKSVNEITRIDAIALDDGGAAVAATGTIAVSGTASADGTLTVTVGSRENHSFDIAVSDTDTATIIGDAIEAALLADLDLPVTPSNAIGTVTLTADNKGTVGNSHGIEVTGTVAGVTYTITAFASGATDPSLTGILDLIDGERYQTIIWPGNYDSATVADYLDARFNSNNDVLDGVAITCYTDTLANHKTELNALNSKSFHRICNKIESESNVYEAGAMFELDYVQAAQFSGKRSLRLTEGANLSGTVITTAGPSDLIGGPALSSLPYFNTPFAGLPLIDQGKGWSSTEIEELLNAGGSVLGNNRTATSIIAGEQVTTYKTDAAGNVDTSFETLNKVDTGVAVRELFFNNLKATYAQHRLTTGDLVPNRAMANQASIEMFLSGLYQTLSGPSYTLTQAGEEAAQFFKKNRSVVLDVSAGSVVIAAKTPIVTQLRTVIFNMQLAFSVA